MLQLDKVSKRYPSGVCALDGVSLTVHTGDYVSITGASGSGKSTLMHVLGLLDTVTEGSYLLDGQNTALLSSDERARVRGLRIGFVFQQFRLLSGLSALDNVALPLALAGVSRTTRTQRAAEVLQNVGLGHRLSHRPHELSGGQQQRVAVARAIVTRPALVLADEPTAGLDPQATEDILGLLDHLHTQGHTIVLITHDPVAAGRARRTLCLFGGKLTE